ncbi:A24 family peptidase [Clostridium sp. D33t1_170424_F3]|uniref:prepilin peptidase n=1 Tax=Clostridium sp. D33t1_170424_F3 TaxID=2787099 RepID=UPI0018A9A032|nr:A24 family peptidase [Clostridium sp. D33t1_170424_F3]
MKRLNWKKAAVWAALPILMALLWLVRFEDLDRFSLLLREMLLAFGYAAALGDAKNKLVPNRLVLVMLGGWMLAMTPQLFWQIEKTLPVLLSGVLGALLGGAVFLTVYLMSRHGLGGGDVKFMAVAGLYLGVQGVLPTMLAGSVLSAVIGLGLVLAGRMDRKGTMPLIPFLYIGILLTTFFR